MRLNGTIRSVKGRDEQSVRQRVAIHFYARVYTVMACIVVRTYHSQLCGNLP